MYPPYPHVRLYVNIYVIYTPVLCMHTGERIRKYLYDIYNCALHTYRRAHGKLALIHTWSNVFHTMWSCAQKIKKRMNNVDIKIRISYLCTYWTTPVFLLRTGERIAKLPGLGVTAELHTGTIKSHLYCLSTPLYAPLLPIRTSIAYTHLYCLYTPLDSIDTSILYTPHYKVYDIKRLEAASILHTLYSTLHSLASWPLRNFILLRFNVTAEVRDSRHKWGFQSAIPSRADTL